jgi:hypothetical protein
VAGSDGMEKMLAIKGKENDVDTVHVDRKCCCGTIYMG